MVYAFFAGHWLLSVLFQSLFQHRYAAPRIFTMGARRERALHLLTWLVQGCFYLAFATHWWQLAFMLPFHFVMCPVHGAIVNWCGHKYGYKNFDNGDQSRNSLPFDFLTMGELFQNNHHKFAQSPDFAARWFEVDPTWQVLRLMAAARLVTLRTEQRAEYPEPLRKAA